MLQQPLEASKLEVLCEVAVERVIDFVPFQG